MAFYRGLLVAVRRAAAVGVAAFEDESRGLMKQRSETRNDGGSYAQHDYAALRAYCQGIPVERIRTLYYSPDSPRLGGDLATFLARMRDELVAYALLRQPAWQDRLGVGRNVPLPMLEAVIREAQQRPSVPERGHRLGQWFRPRLAAALETQGVRNIGELMAMIEQRGPGWWRRIPRVGQGRAASVLRWLARHAASLGVLAAPLRPTASTGEPKPPLHIGADGVLPQLGEFTLPPQLDGSAGSNRAERFCLIAARDDLAAVQDYLAGFAPASQALRAYRRELERLLLWCGLIAHKPLSSMTVADCEAYLAFLAAPDPSFCGLRAPRTSRRWRPFAQQRLDASSLAYALSVLRTAFGYLHQVRYLGGNPWTGVQWRERQALAALAGADGGLPRTGRGRAAAALDRTAWQQLVDAVRMQCREHAATQERVGLAALLLLGESGLTRSELVRATRGALARIDPETAHWGLWLEGRNGRNGRLAPVSARTVAALQAHWRDLGWDFEGGDGERPLLAPLTIPATAAAQRRHGAAGAAGGVNAARTAYSAGAIYALVVRTIRRTCARLRSGPPAASLSAQQLAAFEQLQPRDLRHTFGLGALAMGLAPNELQALLGQASIDGAATLAREHARRQAAQSARLYGDLEP